jgi:DNA-binding IclR family transcriptional regulator
VAGLLNMAGGERYLIRSVQQALAVEDWLAAHSLVEWRRLAEVAAGAGVKRDQTFRILKTLAAGGRVEASDKGWRISPDGLIRYAFQVQKYFSEQAGRLGL